MSAVHPERLICAALCFAERCAVLSRRGGLTASRTGLYESAGDGSTCSSLAVFFGTVTATHAGTSLHGRLPRPAGRFGSHVGRVLTQPLRDAGRRRDVNFGPAGSGAVGDSFEEFVRGRSTHLFQLALLLAGQNQADAGDLLQVALERAWRRGPARYREGSPEPYVRRILVNASIDQWRWLRRSGDEPPGDPAHGG